MSLLKISELTGLLNKVLKEDGRVRKGNNLQYHCPFCHHRKRKLEVHLVAPYEWNCWTCSTKGRGLYWLLKRLNSAFVPELERIVGSYKYIPSTTGNTFLDKMASISNGYKLPSPISPVLTLPAEFKSLADTDGSIEHKIAMNYAIKRKLTPCDIIKYHVGYCPTGPFANRLVFPSYDADNNLNFYSCRSYHDDGYKYKNSEFSKNIIGYENMIDFNYPVSLCEGALDAISLKRNAIPLYGKSLSKKLKLEICKSACPEFNIILDDDALNSAIRIAQYLTSVGKVVKLVRLNGKDPNVLGFEKTMEQIKKTDILDFKAMTMLRLE